MGMQRIEKIMNEAIRVRANISETMREAILNWLGHVARKTEEDVVMRTWKMEVGGHRQIGRPKLLWSYYTNTLH